MEDESVTELKMAINNLIWMHAPENTTLGEVERIATDILMMITKGETR